MQTYIDCYPCFLRQAIEASRMAGGTQAQEREIVLRTLQILYEQPEGATPPAIGTKVHSIVREVTGNDDPYYQVKQESTAKAIAMLPKLRALRDASKDRLETSVRMSIAGNIMDFGPNPEYDLWEVVQRILTQDFAINDMDSLRESLTKADSILFLGDNAGETVFDLLLMEVLEKPVTYVVRGGPVLNDATREDAAAAGIDRIAKVFDNGARVPGTDLSLCSPSFVDHFNTADLILAKGMGNYETLSTVDAPIYFLFQVKCPIIGLDVNAPAGSIVVIKGRKIDY